MAKGTVKRKPTPSATRKKKSMQRIRKKIKQKSEKKRPNWRNAILKTYKKSGGEGKSSSKSSGGAGAVSGSRKRNRGGAASSGAAHGGGEDGEEGPDFENDSDAGEVQSDVDEEKEERLNERDPLETQLFLRNLPLDTTEGELKKYFDQHFGKIRRVLLVRNRISKSLAGTAFVHCGTKELAEKIYTHAQQNARDVSATDRSDFKAKTEGLSHHQAKRLKYKERTDTFIARDPFLTIRDTKFTVFRVLSRSDTVEAVSAAEKKKKRTKVAGDDPRNLYLLQEGLITTESPAARDLHPRYLQMIQDDYETRKQQLKNSNYFVSKTRLSVRNLPRTMTENDLRRLFAEKARDYLQRHKADMEKEKWGKYGPLKNIKLLKDSVGVSKGYGFIEFINHNVALDSLRNVNNNPSLFGDNRRLMVSFAIENINAVQKLQRIKELRVKTLKAGGHKAGGKPRKGMRTAKADKSAKTAKTAKKSKKA